jgi:predicted PurR-regulated permease PerM
VKRKILVIATVTVIALLVATLFVYIQISELQNQIGELQGQNRELQDKLSELKNQIDRSRYVKITDFSWIGGVKSYRFFDPLLPNKCHSSKYGCQRYKRFNFDR